MPGHKRQRMGNWNCEAIDPKATLSITDRAYVIFDGKIKIKGKSEEVAVDPVAKEFYLGKDFQL